MIFEWTKEDDDYHRWFAWRPVFLYGPDEWDRRKRTGDSPRLVWLEFVWRWRDPSGTYYALFDGPDSQVTDGE